MSAHDTNADVATVVFPFVYAAPYFAPVNDIPGI